MLSSQHRMDSYTFLLIITAALFHAIWNFFTKKTNGDKITILWLGQIFTGLVTLPIALYFTDLSILSMQFMPFVILTGIIHALYLSLLGWSYNIGEVSTIYPISRGTGIIGTAIIAVLLEIDQISNIGFLGILILISGILLIAVNKSLNRGIILLSALMVGLSISMYSIVDKLGVQVIPSFFYGSIMFLSTAFFLFPFVLYKRQAHLKQTLRNYKLYSFSIGVAMFSTYNLILFAFRSSPASYVVALREVSIVLAAILGIFFMKEEATKNKIYGISLVVAGAAIIKFS